jgi:hypothetical protein
VFIETSLQGTQRAFQTLSNSAAPQDKETGKREGMNRQDYSNLGELIILIVPTGSLSEF